jgi:hypothetical protein
MNQIFILSVIIFNGRLSVGGHLLLNGGLAHKRTPIRLICLFFFVSSGIEGFKFVGVLTFDGILIDDDRVSMFHLGGIVFQFLIELLALLLRKCQVVVGGWVFWLRVIGPWRH